MWRHDGDRQTVLGVRKDEKGLHAEIPEVSPFRVPAWYATTVHTCTYKSQEYIVRTERVEVRLDPETRLKLEEVAVARGSSVSELVRDLIERSHEQEVAGAARLAAAERIGSMEVEDVPAPDELKRQLSEAHGPGMMS